MRKTQGRRAGLQRKAAAPRREKGRTHPMRTLICDRPRAELETLGDKKPFDVAFCLEDLDDDELGRPDGTQGGQRDGGAPRLAAALEESRELWIAARSFYGQVSAPVMRTLELSERRGEPAAGAGNRNGASSCDLHIWLYGVDEDSREERRLADALAARLASQLGSNLAECRIVHSFDLGLLNQLGALPKTASTPQRTEALPQQKQAGPVAAAGTARAILLLDASDEGGAAHALLDDFEDALLAYDRLSSRALGVSDATTPPRFERLGIHSQGAPEASPAAPFACDTLLIGYPASSGALPSRLVRTLGYWENRGLIPAGTRVYAICTTDGCDPAEAHLSLEVLRLFCSGSGLAWCGGLCVAGASAVAAFARSERMGWKRRGRSEAVDRLIGAVRAGLTIADAARRFGSTDPLAPSNIIDAPCPLPRWAYKLMRDRLAMRPHHP